VYKASRSNFSAFHRVQNFYVFDTLIYSLCVNRKYWKRGGGALRTINSVIAKV